MSHHPDNAAPAEAPDYRGVAAKAFIWVMLALAIAFWAAMMTTAFGILGSSPPGGAQGEADAGGVQWALMTVVGVAVLGGALAFGLYRYYTRPKIVDEIAEIETRREYDDIEKGGMPVPD